MQQQVEATPGNRTAIDPLINVFDYEEAARERIDPVDYDYIAGGATDEVTLRRTREAFDSLELLPRIFQDVRNLDLSTTVLGMRVGFPVLMAPAGGHKKAHPDGELATTRAVTAMETVMAVSAHSSYAIEEIAAAAPTPLWLGLYMFKDREMTKEWVRRAEATGCKALCVTADAFWPPKRERVIRHRIRRGSTSDGLGPNYGSLQEAPDIGRSVVIPNTGRSLADPGATWADIAWLKSLTSLPVVIKGVMTAEDATMAARCGVEGIIVSNHGGRNVDTTRPTISALPEIAATVNGKLEVYLDGGIRRGTDVIKALALGARAVFIGRPIFWGLAQGGEPGLRRLLAILREEMESAMAICGSPNVASIAPSLVAK